MNAGKRIAYVFALCLPWKLRRLMLVHFFKYDIHPSSRIGLSWIAPRRLIVGPNCRIGSLNVVKGLELLRLDESSIIGNLNWITGFPVDDPRHYSQVLNRKVELHLHRHSAITNRHLLDCTDQVSIGEFSIVAGFRSQLLTHSVDLASSTQACAPIQIGAYCFVGTHCTILGDSRLPDYSVLGAHSLLERRFNESYQLYGGVPARALKPLRRDLAFFGRQTGYVD
jgi:acetyltransferase-like isoleucine patch superfamily enzyme